MAGGGRGGGEREVHRQFLPWEESIRGVGEAMPHGGGRPARDVAAGA